MVYSDFIGMIFWGKQGLFYKRPFHNSITDFRKYPPTKSAGSIMPPADLHIIDT